MSSALTSQERDYLARAFRLRSVAEADARSVISHALLDEKCCRALLEHIMPMIDAPDLAITASLLTKRLAFLATGNVLYAMTVFDKALTLRLDNTRFEYAHDNGLWTSSLPVDIPWVSRPSEGERDTWRAQVVGALFKGYLAPIWRSLAQVSGAPEQILWENCAVRIYSLYEGRMDDLSASQQARRQDDFNWLLERASPDVFGLEWNPLARFRRPLRETAIAGRKVRYRRTCCFYYKASHPVEYCQNCPLLKK